jgi:pyroglutamyl-peptidase
VKRTARPAGADGDRVIAARAASPGHHDRPRLLVTGFGPFPGAPANPTEALVAALSDSSADQLGGSVLKAVVLPTDYRRSWAMLRGLYARHAPDIVVHFGLSDRLRAVHVEQVARNVANPAKPDVTGYAPTRVRRIGPDMIRSTLPVAAIHAALTKAGIPAALSDDAGAYVCNATLYRSLHAAPEARSVGFIHVPPEGRVLSGQGLVDMARIALSAAASAWRLSGRRER